LEDVGGSVDINNLLHNDVLEEKLLAGAGGHYGKHP
jgi:hypothetical protein